MMVEIRDRDRTILYTSDVDGPVLESVTESIIEAEPDILILDGPPTYLLGFITAYYNLARSIINICRIMREAKPELIILDHHPVRDYRYPDLLHEVYRVSEDFGVDVLTVAELVGVEPKVLEGYRRYGPTRWKKWRPVRRDDIINVLRNAVENGLIEAKWLNLARSLF